MLFHYVLAALLVAQGCLARSGLRITDGDESPPHQFPHMVSIVWGIPPIISYRHLCGGTIVSKNWVLTAAHCVDEAPLFWKLGVYAGKHIINHREDGQQFSSVALRVLHWKYAGNEHDIALLRLATPLEFSSFVKAINLPIQGTVPTGDGILSGWGSISKKWLPKYPAILQTATIPIVTNDECYTALHELPKDPKIYDTQMCTGPIHGTVSACGGDGGDPLIQYDDYGDAELIGVVSWSSWPCGAGSPTVYTRVSEYVDWITAKLNDRK